MSKFRFPMNLQLFAEGDAVDPGVESASAAEMQATPNVDPASQTGVDDQAAAEPEKQNNFEKAFAKRLADAEAKWEARAAEKYKDYDVAQKAMQYVQREYGIGDVMTLKEQLELAELQDRAASENLTVDELQRRQELEDLKAWKNQVEQQQQEGERVTTYNSALEEFVKDKGIESAKLNQFMIENGMTYDPENMDRSFTVAYKAMMHDELASKVGSAEKDGVKKFLQAKGSIPTVPGTNAQGQTVSPAPKTWAEARARAMQRE